MSDVRSLRLPEVKQLTGLAKATLYEQIAKGKFPRPMRLSPGAVGWVESEVQAWLKRRLAARGPQFRREQPAPRKPKAAA